MYEETCIWGYYLIGVVFCITVIGCGNSDIGGVKSGTMGGHESTTIGKAFDASFDNPKWTNFETKKGQKVVEFTGNISEELHDTAVKSLLSSSNLMQLYTTVGLQVDEKKREAIGKAARNETEKMQNVVLEWAKDKHWKTGTLVKVQWVILQDGESCKIESIISDAWGGLRLDTILDVIYM